MKIKILSLSFIFDRKKIKRKHTIIITTTTKKYNRNDQQQIDAILIDKTFFNSDRKKLKIIIVYIQPNHQTEKKNEIRLDYC
mgnify:CR=1 FL=1